jgi:hypothetical protein
LTMGVVTRNQFLELPAFASTWCYILFIPWTLTSWPIWLQAFLILEHSVLYIVVGYFSTSTQNVHTTLFTLSHKVYVLACVVCTCLLVGGSCTIMCPYRISQAHCL